MVNICGIEISYELLTALFILIVDVIIFFITLFRKNKRLLDVYGTIDNCLPFYIDKAEEKYPSGFGEIKKDLVVRAVFGTLLDSFKNVNPEKYRKYIEDRIELLLTTPSKKGD